MADEMILQVEGLSELIKTFQAYFTDIDTSPIMIRAMAKIGVEIEAQAKENLQENIYNKPEGWYLRSGFLKAHLSSDSPTGGGGELGVNVRAKQKYSVWVEMGTGIYAKNGDGRKTPWVFTAIVRGNKFSKTGKKLKSMESFDVDFWTRGMKPRPFLLPALQIKAKRAQEILEEALTEFLQAKIQTP